MDSHNHHLPPYIPNPWDPPPPPPPPPPFQWAGNPGFPNDGFPPPFHPFPLPPHHDPSFAAPPPNFCPPKPQFPRKRKFDRADNDDYVKLYVVGVPRNVTQEEIYRLFEEYGNVVEVILLADKQTGQQHEYCFVKYSLIEEADRAIKALHNQFVFPEAMLAIKVRYAEKGKQRQGVERSVQHDPCLPRTGVVQNNSIFSRPVVGEPLHKLYVNGLNKEASHQEIEEIFSSYGVVADIYIMRDERKQSRGCGFVGFSQKYMAVAAINGLNGSYVMKGCDNPLVVRFAEPKKPKNVDLRPALNSMDMQGSNMSNAQHMGNSSTSMQVNPIGIQAGSFSTVANRSENSVTSGMQKRLHSVTSGMQKQLQQPIEMQKQLQQPISPSRFSQMSLQNSQPWQGSPQSYRQTDSQLQTPLHSNQTSVSSIERRHDHQSRRDTGSNSIVLITEPASGVTSRSDVLEDPLECEWSEHICPDGCKYYYNCVTCESRWEKPEEFALYEPQLRRRHLHNHSMQERSSVLKASTLEEKCDIEVAQDDQNEICDLEKPQLAMSCAVEHTHGQVPTETSTLSGPAFVQ